MLLECALCMALQVNVVHNVISINPWAQCGGLSCPTGTLTGRCLKASASCRMLVLDRAVVVQEDDLKREGTVPGGFLAPAAALGTVLVDRLRQSGIAVVVRERHGIA